jgi:hypothetical protein
VFETEEEFLEKKFPKKTNAEISTITATTEEIHFTARIRVLL